MSMAELVKAGAPELPEGYFYRVKPFLGSTLEVQVRRQRRYLGSEEASFALVYPSSFSDGQAAIIDGCRRAFERWYGAHERYRKVREAAESLGDHNPRGRAQ